MEKESITLSYDADDDILHLTIGTKAEEAISVEEDDEVFVRIHPVTKEIVGMTILGFSEYFAETLLSKREGFTFTVGSVDLSEFTKGNKP